jgi:rhodanese-related sulfurtransferase
MNNWIWWVAAAAVLIYFLRPGVPATANLVPADLKEWMAGKKDLQLIDVRSPGEFSEGHLIGAKLLPLGELSGRLKELDPQKPLVLYCRSGNRSGQALKILLSNGYPEAKHLQGGITAWQGAGLPVTR